MTIIQILAVIFFSFAASRAILRAKDKKITIIELFFWLSIWFGLIFIVFFPDYLSKIANFLGIGRGTDVLVYSSIVILFYLLFRLYVKLDELESEITKLVREIALKKKK
ncbi:MAG: DUF2304 family protein [Candidatus Woesearchaeota archaeon]